MIHIKLEVALGYIKYCLKERKQKQRKNPYIIVGIKEGKSKIKTMQVSVCVYIYTLLTVGVTLLMAESKGVSELKHEAIPFSLHGFVSTRRMPSVCEHLQRSRESLDPLEL